VADELWQRLLDETWATLDREAPDVPDSGPVWAGGLYLTGDPGHLPSRLPTEDAAIACAGTALLAAAALHAGRGGPVLRPLRLDRAHVAAAFRSEAWLRVNGEPSGPGFAPLSRFWRAADGWVRTHANYPWHRDVLLRALGSRDDPDSVAAAIAGRSAREVEDLVSGAGGVAAAVYVERRGYFGMLSVAPALQGHGLGKRLVRIAEALCEAAGCDVMRLRIINLREELGRWYRSLGYREVGTTPYTHRPVKQPCHFIDMERPLRAPLTLAA